MLFLGAFAEEFSNHGALNIGVIFTLGTLNRRVTKIAADVALQEQVPTLIPVFIMEGD